MKIPISKTLLTDEEISSVLEPLRSGWLVQGPKVKSFENAWSEFTGAKYSVAVSSCTTALQVSLKALGFGLGDQAIIPAFSWISTANIVEHLGGEVIFSDIDLSTFNIDLTNLDKLITPKTKVIIPVHLFGLPANMVEINKFAKKHKLFVVEDAACGFGARIGQKHVGNFGNTGCFSFHPRKSITTGEGGMVTTNNYDLAEKIRCLVNHGAIQNDLQRHLGPRPYILSDHSEAGFNYRMTDIQGALGFEQMKRADQILLERRNLARRYNEAFKDVSWLNIPKEENNSLHGYQSYPCMFMPDLVKEELKTNNYKKIENIKKLRNKFMDKLNDEGVSTRPATHAIHMLRFYKNKYKLKKESFPNAYSANNCSISFPLFNGMTNLEQDYVIENVLKLFKNIKI